MEHVRKFESEIFNSGHVHFAGYFNLASLQSDDLVEFLRALRERNIPISLDPQSDVTDMWTGKDSNFHKVLPLLDFFFPSDNEALSICRGYGFPTDSLEEAAKYLSGKLHPKAYLVLKCSADGAKVYQQGALLASVGVYRTAVVDTTGAGDSFNAGFLAGWRKTRNIEVALQYGAASGAVRVSTLGGCELPPSIADLEAIIKGARVPDIVQQVATRKSPKPPQKSRSWVASAAYVSLGVLLGVGLSWFVSTPLPKLGKGKK